MPSAPHCERIDLLLVEYVYEELSSDASEAVERHVEGCARCRSELQALQQTQSAFAGLPDLEPSPRVTYDILREARKAAADKQERPAPLLRFLLSPAFASAAVLVVASGAIVALTRLGADEPAATLVAEEAPAPPPPSATPVQAAEKAAPGWTGTEIAEEGEETTLAKDELEKAPQAEPVGGAQADDRESGELLRRVSTRAAPRPKPRPAAAFDSLGLEGRGGGGGGGVRGKDLGGEAFGKRGLRRRELDQQDLDDLLAGMGDKRGGKKLEASPRRAPSEAPPAARPTRTRADGDRDTTALWSAGNVAAPGDELQRAKQDKSQDGAAARRGESAPDQVAYGRAEREQKAYRGFVNEDAPAVAQAQAPPPAPEPQPEAPPPAEPRLRSKKRKKGKSADWTYKQRAAPPPQVYEEAADESVAVPVSTASASRPLPKGPAEDLQTRLEQAFSELDRARGAEFDRSLDLLIRNGEVRRSLAQVRSRSNRQGRPAWIGQSLRARAFQLEQDGRLAEAELVWQLLYELAPELRSEVAGALDRLRRGRRPPAAKAGAPAAPAKARKAVEAEPQPASIMSE